MIIVRRAEARHSDRHHKREIRLTFCSQNPADPFADGLGPLVMLNEDRLPPGADVPQCTHHDAEMVAYVREGALTYKDSVGGSGIIRAGEFQRMTCGARHSEKNASRTDWARVFRIGLRPSEAGLEGGYEGKRFSAAERRGRLCVVASPDARKGSLRIHQDVRMYSAMLDPGQHVVHELSPGRSAWLHLVQGDAALSDMVLHTGDGAAITAARAVSLTAREETEILLFDVSGELPASSDTRGVP